MDLKQIQAEVSEWSVRNFGPPKDSLDTPGSISASDIVVDAGKLCHHQLKADQGIRGSSEGHADSAFFVTNNLIESSTSFLCNQRLDSEDHRTGVDRIPGIRCIFGLAEEVGELMLAGRRGEDRDARDAVGDIAIYLLDFCNARGYSLADILEETWSQVKRRDWTKNKSDGSA